MMNFSTKQDIINNMGIGWTLGNSLTAYPYEITFQQPTTTKILIDKVKSLGFNTIRIPVHWHYHCSAAPEYLINSVWLDRVAEVVNYALDNDMFVILNSHGDELETDNSNYYEITNTFLVSIWRQIAEYFIDYDEKLIFEIINEPHATFGEFVWSVDTQTNSGEILLQNTNQIMQNFINTIREIDVNRYLIVTSYCSNYYFAIDNHFIFPTDEQERTFLSFHTYAPHELCLADADDTDSRTDFTEADQINTIDPMFAAIKSKFLDNNINVIITEMGIRNKNNPETREAWASYILGKCAEYNIPAIIWDDGGEAAYGLIDRDNNTVYDSAQNYLNGIFPQ